MTITLLAIESSCDDTSAAVIRDGIMLSNVIAGQKVHEEYGGVVPELASRAHQENIVQVVEVALKRAGVNKEEIAAIAYTRGPGLMGSLLVGTSFAKGFAIAGGIPLIDVNHLHGHVLSHYIGEPGVNKEFPGFPHLSMLVSGGHTLIVKVTSHYDMEILGRTIDDAAGEAFDKCAKVMGLPYPGGPHINRLANDGNPMRFRFAKPRIPELGFSFSGLKTSFLYFLRDELAKDPSFIENNINDLCASLQHTITEILSDKINEAVKITGIKSITLSGGVSANSYLRQSLTEMAEKRKWKLFLPSIAFTTDNAAMIGIAGYYKYLKGRFSRLADAPDADMPLF